MKQEKNLILAISSASKDIEVALVKDGEVLAEHFASDSGSENLMQYVDAVLKYSGQPLKDCSLIAVTIGPGSYGGLRGGLASAKALAQSLDIPMASVSTLEAVAYNMVDAEALVVAALPAMKDEYNMAIFGCHDKKVVRVTEDLVAHFSAIAKALAKIEERFYLLSPKGEIFDAVKKLDPSSKVTMVSGRSCFPRASSVAALALIKSKLCETSDVISSLPHYSHDPNIREFKAKPRP